MKKEKRYKKLNITGQIYSSIIEINIFTYFFIQIIK